MRPAAKISNLFLALIMVRLSLFAAIFAIAVYYFQHERSTPSAKSSGVAAAQNPRPNTSRTVLPRTVSANRQTRRLFSRSQLVQRRSSGVTEIQENKQNRLQAKAVRPRTARNLFASAKTPNVSARANQRLTKRPSVPFHSSLELKSLVRSASDQHNIDPNLIWAVMKVESNFDTRAVSHKGARGLMQLMPDTARLHNVRNIHDPAQNIQGGVSHLKLLLDRFKGDLILALAAYNAGAGAVETYNAVPPYKETRQYVRRVLSYYQLYRDSGTIFND